jgi:hypothetical protein
MRRRQILKVIPFFISLWASAAYTQNRPDDADRLFDIAAAKHKRELADLWAARGAPRIELPDASSESIARVLAVRTEESRIGWRGQYSEITYPDRTAVLFYSYDEGNLQVWLVDALGIQAYHKQSISKRQISKAIINLRNSLNVDSLQRSRVPRQRVSIEVVPVATHTGESCDRAITNLTQILLPTTVANKLDTVKHLIIVPILEIGTVPYAILRPFRDDSVLSRDRRKTCKMPSKALIFRCKYQLFGLNVTNFQTFIGKEFSAHLAGFFVYLGSIPFSDKVAMNFMCCPIADWTFN